MQDRDQEGGGDGSEGGEGRPPAPPGRERLPGPCGGGGGLQGPPQAGGGALGEAARQRRRLLLELERQDPVELHRLPQVGVRLDAALELGPRGARQASVQVEVHRLFGQRIEPLSHRFVPQRFMRSRMRLRARARRERTVPTGIPSVSAISSYSSPSATRSTRTARKSGSSRASARCSLAACS